MQNMGELAKEANRHLKQLGWNASTPLHEALGYNSEHPFACHRSYSPVVKVMANSFHSRFRAPGEARVGSQRNLDFSGQHLPKAKFLIT
jgi:hypothetical protein